MNPFLLGAMLLLLPCLAQAQPTGSPASLRHLGGLVEVAASIYATLAVEEYDHSDDDSLGPRDEESAIDPRVTYYAEIIAGGIHNEHANYMTPARLLFRESQNGNNNNNNNEADEEDLFIGVDLADVVLRAIRYIIYEGLGYSLAESDVRRLWKLHADCESVISLQERLANGQPEEDNSGEVDWDWKYPPVGTKRNREEADETNVETLCDGAPPTKCQNLGSSSSYGDDHVNLTGGSSVNDENAAMKEEVARKARKNARVQVRKGGDCPPDELIKINFLRRNPGTEDLLDSYLEIYKERWREGVASLNVLGNQAARYGEEHGWAQGVARRELPSEEDLHDRFFQEYPGLRGFFASYLKAYKVGWSDGLNGEASPRDRVIEAARRNGLYAGRIGRPCPSDDEITKHFLKYLKNQPFADCLPEYIKAYKEAWQEARGRQLSPKEQAEKIGNIDGTRRGRNGKAMPSEFSLLWRFQYAHPELRGCWDVYLKAYEESYHSAKRS